MEQVLDWLNENELRAYPLMDTPDRLLSLPDNFLLDLQIVTPISLYSEQTGDVPVYLKSIARQNEDDLVVLFGTVDAVITSFVIENASTQTYPKYVRNSQGCLAVFGAGAGVCNLVGPFGQLTTSSSLSIDIALWREPITLTTGNDNVVLYSSSQAITDFSSSVTGRGNLTLNHVTYCKFPVTSVAILNIQVEPSTCTEFSGAWLGVQSIGASPEKRTEDFAGEVCTPEHFAPKLPLYDVESNNTLIGDVQFLEGYNFRVSTAQNAIDLEIGQDYGLRMNCCTSFMPSEYLDCHELVSYINGVPPDSSGNFRLNPGSNIDITSGAALDPFYDPVSELTHSETANRHSLFVGLSFSSSELCAPIVIPPL